MINDKYADLLKDKYKESYSLFKNGKPTIAFSSHQPVLFHLLNTVKEGKVMEFGMGFNSTPLFHIICGMQNRKLVSIDTNPSWLNKFIGYRSTLHAIKLMPAKEVANFIDPIFDEHYSIAFVDGAPAELRQPFLEKIKADYIIIHDTECVVQGVKNVYAYDFSMFKQVFHFKTVPPMTSLISNLEGISEEITHIFDLI